MHRLPRLVFLALTLLAAHGSTAFAQSVTLAWDRNPEPDVTGYRLYYGTSPRTYTNQVDVGNQITYQVTGLDVSLNYYFAVQAYNRYGVSSGLSQEVGLPAPVPPGTTTISSFTANVAFPVLMGTTVTWTAQATSQRGAVEYKFLKQSPSTGWQIVQDYSPASTFSWTPTIDDLGMHTVQVWARTVGSPAPFEAWVGTNPFEVTASPVRLSANFDFPVPPNQPVRWTASIAGAPGALEYSFYVQNRATGAWSQLRAYSPDNQVTWTPTAVGTYAIQVWARRIGSLATYQVYGTTETLTVSRTPLTAVSLTANRTLPALTGTPITWTARTRGGMAGPLEFQFYLFSFATNTWRIVRPYSPSNEFIWTPTWGDQGRYVMQVWARNAGSLVNYDAWLGTNEFEIRLAPIQLTTTSAFPVPPGTAVQWSASVADPSANLQYAFFLYNRATGTWTNVQAYSASNTFTWTPSATGSYLIQVWGRRVGSTASYDVYRSTEYLEVSRTPARITGVTADVALPSAVGTDITWTAAGVGGTASPLQYRFHLYTAGQGWTLLRDYGSSNTLTWTPTAPGTYTVQVWVRSAGSTQQYEGWFSTPSFVIRP
jgi:N-acetylmuramoyl-L-alanine amidase